MKNLAKIHDAIRATITDKLISLHDNGDMDFEGEISDNIKSQCKDVFDNYVDAKTYTPYEFMALFTQAEQDAIVSSNNISVKMFISGLYTTSAVITDFPATVQGMNYLVSIGLLTESRKAEILS